MSTHLRIGLRLTRVHHQRAFRSKVVEKDKRKETRQSNCRLVARLEVEIDVVRALQEVGDIARTKSEDAHAVLHVFIECL